MIDVNGGAPQWEKFYPFDEDQDVSCEIKQLCNKEGLKLQGLLRDLQDDDGNISGDIYNDDVMGLFETYVKNIEGIKIGGISIATPTEMFDPSVKRSKPLHDFYTGVMYKFFQMTSMVGDESKNSEGSPVGSMESQDEVGKEAVNS